MEKVVSFWIVHGIEYSQNMAYQTHAEQYLYYFTIHFHCTRFIRIKSKKNFIEHEQILCAALVCVITIHFISVDTSSQLHSIESNFLHSTAAAIFIRRKVR